MASSQKPGWFSSVNDIPIDIFKSLDAILVLGGGVPENPLEPPIYVKERCKVAADIYNQSMTIWNNQDIKILTLSAGTAHSPQLLSGNGLPIWEATVSATYLIDDLSISPSNIYVETTSYDTISNAFFARTNFVDFAGWKNLLMITNEFHIERTKAIFDWVFEVNDNDESNYKLYYFSAPNTGLSQDAVQARKAREQKSLDTVNTKLSKQYKTLPQVFEFLTKKHDFYNSKQLSMLSKVTSSDGSQTASDKLLKESYGLIKPNHQAKGGKTVFRDTSFVHGFLVASCIGIMISFVNVCLSKSKNNSLKRR